MRFTGVSFRNKREQELGNAMLGKKRGQANSCGQPLQSQAENLEGARLETSGAGTVRTSSCPYAKPFGRVPIRCCIGWRIRNGELRGHPQIRAGHPGLSLVHIEARASRRRNRAEVRLLPPRVSDS